MDRSEMASFHGTINEKKAEEELKKHGVDCFLMRYNKDRNFYLLSVMTSGDNGHETKFEEYQVLCDSSVSSDTYIIFKIQGREEVFDRIDNLLKFYQKNSISQTTASIGEPLQRKLK